MLWHSDLLQVALLQRPTKGRRFRHSHLRIGHLDVSSSGKEDGITRQHKASFNSSLLPLKGTSIELEGDVIDLTTIALVEVLSKHEEDGSRTHFVDTTFKGGMASSGGHN